MDTSSEALVAPLWAAAGFSMRSTFMVLFLVAIVLRFIYQVTYNLFFHPLAKFPGPVLARASLLWRFWFSQSGRFHRVIESQHACYGPVVRVAPNELSFASATSLKAIYGHAAKGRDTLIKSEFYDMYGSGYDSLCIGSERDPQTHARMKKSLSAAFSTTALIEQEEIVQRCVDGFVDKVGHESKLEKGINMSDWYEMIAFDVLGEMAFGETFHCIENEKPHFWIDLLTKHLFFITLIDNLRRVPLLLFIGKYLLPRFTVGVRDKHSGYSRAKVERRLQSVSPRKDILTNIVDKVKSGEVSQEEMTAHASTLVIAGGETVSTFLTATTYYLCKTPDAYQKLQNEVRTRYQSYGDIKASSALQLPYLQAVIQEGLRIFPPGSQGFPRLSPGVMIDNFWIPAGTEVYTSAWTVTHDPQYFHDPEKFLPERWLDPDCTDLKEASQPFSLGSRGCLGKNFAMVEMSLVLSKILYRYDLEIVNKELDWESSCHMHVNWWKPKLNVRFLKRK